MITITTNNNKIDNITLNIASHDQNNDANLSNSCLHELFLSDCKTMEKMFNDFGVSNTHKDNGTKSNKKKHITRSYCKVDDEMILYKLSDAGLLNKMHGLRLLESGNVYYFDRDPDVLQIVEKYTKANELEAVTENTHPVEN